MATPDFVEGRASDSSTAAAMRRETSSALHRSSPLESDLG
jgi:hypothetical protein